MSRKNRSRKKRRFSRKMRKMMKMGVTKIPEHFTSTKNTTSTINDLVTETSKTINKPEPNKIPTDRISPAQFKITDFEKLKFKEILAHLKTVMLISVLCLAIVGFLFFLELKIHWVNQILLSPFFSGK